MNQQELMEKEVKEFDRSVEHIMNEYSVTPPFGAWNRIASALDTASVAEFVQPEVLAASATYGWKFYSLLGTVILAGLTTVGVYFNYSPSTISTSTTPQIQTVVPSTVTIDEKTTLKQPPSLSVSTMGEAKVEKSVSVGPKPPVVAQEVQVATVNAEVAPQVVSTDVNTENVFAGSEEQYLLMFPAIDREETEVMNSNLQPKVSDEEEELHVKSKSNATTYKMKFKKPKRPKFNYGRFNRIK